MLKTRLRQNELIDATGFAFSVAMKTTRPQLFDRKDLRRSKLPGRQDLCCTAEPKVYVLHLKFKTKE